MIRLSFEGESLLVTAAKGDLLPRHRSQLAFWGFSAESEGCRFVSSTNATALFVKKISDYLSNTGLAFETEDAVLEVVAADNRSQSELENARRRGRAFKEGQADPEEARQFMEFLERKISRPLKKHQVKAALHLLATGNGANFSVPGSGKSAVVLAVFAWLRHRGLEDALFVVGPPSCFGPWKAEYEATLGHVPSYEILAGGDIEDRRARYRVNRDTARDLYLTTFNTLQRDEAIVRNLLERQGVRFLLVVDEAHYIKRVDGAWATAVLNIARGAQRRCVLTGTPFPRRFTDGFNLFDLLWPEAPPIPSDDKVQLEVLSEQRDVEKAVEILNRSIGPLFYRVRKSDLNLAPQDFREPIVIRMKRHEKFIYDSIAGQIKLTEQSDYFRDRDARMRLQRGRMMRLRQCLSYAKLVQSAISDYSEDLLEGELSVADTVHHYDELETPAKLDVLCGRVQQLKTDSQKVVVWSNFVGSLKLITTSLNQLGIGAQMIYGGTPVQDTGIDEELSREAIIQDFLQPNGNTDVLVANPAACAESISLHKSCSHAIYYDLSYNCAQYLQSLDRIHRVGGSEDTVAHYDFLQYEDTIDEDILNNVRTKAERMSRIIDQEYPVYGLDMLELDDELAAYERLFRE